LANSIISLISGIWVTNGTLLNHGVGNEKLKVAAMLFPPQCADILPVLGVYVTTIPPLKSGGKIADKRRF
jgi:hypothetical protein